MDGVAACEEWHEAERDEGYIGAAPSSRTFPRGDQQIGRGRDRAILAGAE
jgi:hypothetical protein